MTRDPCTTVWSESQAEDSGGNHSSWPQHIWMWTTSIGCRYGLMLPLMEVCVKLWGPPIYLNCLWDAAKPWLRNWPELIGHGLGQHTQAHMTVNANKQPAREFKWTTSRAQTEDCAQIRGGLHHWRWRFPRVEGLPGSSQGSGPGRLAV